jgi:hypothetical protein
MKLIIPSKNPAPLTSGTPGCNNDFTANENRDYYSNSNKLNQVITPESHPILTAHFPGLIPAKVGVS